MSPRLTVLLALALGCSANAPGGSVNTDSDSGTVADAPSGGGSLGSVCASICNGSGPTAAAPASSAARPPTRSPPRAPPRTSPSCAAPPTAATAAPAP
ncbi:MAG: hypothetical protein IPN17_36180 [Deltaproteobacteria bacterium]|nr:hypothetical protein [Deltaproteobacteria bacterium]